MSSLAAERVELPRVLPARRSWPAILAHAAQIVAGYDTGVTLRQLFYRLVSDGTLLNTASAYGALSSRTAEARRAGGFPDLLDRTRTIHRHTTFDGAAAARQWLADVYRRDRTEGQQWSVYLAVEKGGLVEQLEGWFGYFGLPILALCGYSSESFVQAVAADVQDAGRPAVLLYGGDFDPSGEDILRDFVGRCGCFGEVVRVALTAEQVVEYGLPEFPGKATDARARGFIERHGRLAQVEVDALPPDALRRLFRDAIERFFDVSTFGAAVQREQAERAELAAEVRL